jgi:caa(3)-type oxidase subunit IV
LCLTVVTVWIGQYNFGSFNMFIAMGIAAIKASLVMTFFMHLKYDTAVNNIFILSSFFFLGLLFLFTLSDFVTRGDADPKLKERAPLENVTPLWDPPHGAGHGPDAGHGHK